LPAFLREMYTTIPVIRSIIYQSVARGANLQELCACLKLSQEDLNHSDQIIKEVELVFALWKKALESTGDKYLGLHIGNEISPSMLGLVGYLMQNSPTALDAYKAFVEHQRKVSGWFSYELHINDNEVSLIVILHPVWLKASPATAFHGLSMALAGTLNVIQMVSSVRIVPLYAELIFPGRGMIAEYENVLNCRVFFSREKNRIVFRKSDLIAPVLNYDQSLHALFNKLLKNKDKEAKKELTLSERLQEIIVNDFKGQAPPIEIIASYLNQSVRSLQRKLKANGISYRLISKESKKRLAINILENSNAKIADVAKVLGYSEVASFRKAFKTWTNTTPIMVRKATKRI